MFILYFGLEHIKAHESHGRANKLKYFRIEIMPNLTSAQTKNEFSSSLNSSLKSK